MGCFVEAAGCPEEDGPDWDFGASVILAEIDNEKSVLFAGRKSGHVYALDPDNQGKLQKDLAMGNLLMQIVK